MKTVQLLLHILKILIQNQILEVIQKKAKTTLHIHD